MTITRNAHQRQAQIHRNAPLPTAHFTTILDRDFFESDDLHDAAGLVEAFSRLESRYHALVDRDGRMVEKCAGTENILGMGTCLFLEDGRLRTVRADLQGDLDRLLAVKGEEIETFVLPCSLTGGHLILRSTAVSEQLVALSLQPAGTEVEPEFVDLEDVFELTETESKVVRDLFLGKTPQQIAFDHGNSIHTIRAHIRRCYDKLGVNCREQLWRKLSSYRIF